MKSKLVDNVEKYVKKQIEIYKEVSLDHYDFWEEHVKYVYDESLLLAGFYDADKEIVALGALLHDIALINRVGEKKDHHINGEIIGREVLTKYNCDEKKKERILKCIYNHRSSNNAQSIEELCVADADILAHFDNVQMLLNIAYNKEHLNGREAKEWLKEALEKDYNDLSVKTKEKYRNKYKKICDYYLENR